MWYTIISARSSQGGSSSQKIMLARSYAATTCAQNMIYLSMILKMPQVDSAIKISNCRCHPLRMSSITTQARGARGVAARRARRGDGGGGGGGGGGGDGGRSARSDPTDERDAPPASRASPACPQCTQCRERCQGVTKLPRPRRVLDIVLLASTACWCYIAHKSCAA